jgi:hypothetical protein
VVNDLADPLAAHRSMPTTWKTHDRSALVPIMPLRADNSPTAYVVISIEQPRTWA